MTKRFVSHWEPNKLKHYREFFGLYQSDMAEAIGTRQQTISNWENGDHMPNPMSTKVLDGYFEEKEKEFKRKRKPHQPPQISA